MNQYWTNNENLKSEIKELEYNVFDKNIKFLSDEGVFSKNKIDAGSDLLIKTYLKYHKERLNVLDVGCGYGTIGITLNLITNSKVDMIDINKRSVHLTQRNIKINKCENVKPFYSDAYENVNDYYDIVITNPPIRVGNEKLLEILTKSKEYLNKNGELWFVIRKDQGGLTIKKKLENIYNIDVKEKKKGYIIFCGSVNRKDSCNNEF